MSRSLVNVFGDAAVDFGLSRPAGQCLAAIWLARAPLPADDLVASLGLSRSNVSTALKELRGWGLVTAERPGGTRRELLSAPDDPWELLRLLLAARQRRVLAPLAERLLAAEADSPDARVASLHEAVARAAEWLGGLSSADAGQLRAALSGAPAKKGKKKKKK